MDFSSMSGWDFEQYCADCLLKKGFTKAEVTSGSGDHGVDIIAEQNGIRFGIQCKLYQGQIPNKAVQEAYTGASYYDCDIAVIMSNSELTRQAKDEAKKLRVKFWDIADYMPKDKKVAQNATAREVAQTIDENIPKSYEEYVQSQEAIDEKLIKGLQLQFDKTMIDSNEHGSSISGSYTIWGFKKAELWVKESNFRLKPFMVSINCYYDEVQHLPPNVDKVSILLGKFAYIRTLRPMLVSVCDRLRKQFWNECAEIKENLLDNLKGLSTIDSSKFNLKYWDAQYLYRLFLEVVPLFEKIGQCFTDEELAQIYNIEKKKWWKTGSIVESAIGDGIKEWKELICWWRGFIDFIECKKSDVTPYNEDSVVADTIEKYKSNLEDTVQRTLRYREYYFIEQQKIIARKNAERAKRLEEREELERQQSERERLIKEKQEAEKREREIELQKKEKEEYEKAVQEEEQRKKLLQVILAFISHEAEHKENVEKICEKREKYQKDAEEKIRQAQLQIDELSKQKSTFSLFRKKRDAELDIKIGKIEKHIEDIKQELIDNIAKCDAEIQARNY